MKRFSSGFTLAEIAIVVVISGILMTMGVKAFSAYLTNTQREATRQRHATLGTALVSYLAANRRLPCPDIGFTGTESRSTPGNAASRCTLTNGRVFGRVPFVTLGVPRELAMDAMGNYITYEVQESNTVPRRDWTRTANFSTVNTGTFIVRTRPDASPGVPINLTTQAVVVLVSHGGNGAGAFNLNGTQNTTPVAANAPDERNNVPGAGDPTPGTYFQRPYSENASAANGGPFDDIVTFFNPSDLLSASVNSGILADSQTLTRQRMTRLQQVVIGYAIQRPVATGGGANCTDITVLPVCHRLAFAAATNNGVTTVNNVNAFFPYVTYGFPQVVPGTPPDDALDAWGNVIRYRLGDVTSPPATARQYVNPGYGTLTAITTNAFVLTSLGPDAVLGTADDITLTTTKNELLARVP